MITTFCPRCGSENPFENQFCGKCGIPLLQPKPAEPVAVSQGAHNAAPRSFSALEPEGDNDQSLHGPSFLGLSDEPDLSSNYLLDDEQPSSHWGVYAILVLLAVGALLAWRQVRAGGLNRSNLAAIVQNVRSKVTQEKQEAASVSPGANPGAGENSNAGNSPAPTPAAETSATPGGNGSAGTAPATPAPTAAEIQSAAQTQRVPAPPAALSQTAELAKPPAPAAGKPKSRVAPREAIDKARSPDAQDAPLLADAQKYLYGDGVPRSCDRALSYLRQAVDIGSVKAKSTLGGLYATGHCVPLDRAVSYKWFALALRQEPNNSYLSHDLEMLWNQMSPQEKRLAIRMTQ